MRSRTSHAITTESSSRRVYLMRRFAWGLILVGLVHLFFGGEEYKSLTFDIACFALAVLLWLVAGRMNRSRLRDPESMDENGNAKKTIL